MDDAKPDGFRRILCRAGEPASLTMEPDHVGEQLVKAFRTLDRCRACAARASGRPLGAPCDRMGRSIGAGELPQEERTPAPKRQNERLLRPTGAEIKQMDLALECSAICATPIPAWHLSRAFGRCAPRGHRSMKALCKERHWAPHTFYRKRAKALEHWRPCSMPARCRCFDMKVR